MSTAIVKADGEVVEPSEMGFVPQQFQPGYSMAIQLASALVDKRIATAKNWPRSVARFKDQAKQLLSEDKETAASAEYAKPVGKGTVTGPSIRLAELAAMCWGNLEVEVGEPTVNDKNVVVKATAWDLERNYRQEAVATTSIVDKSGRRFANHMIETASAATVSKAKRNAIIAVIPRSYITVLLDHAREVARGIVKTLEERRAMIVQTFARKRIEPQQLCESLGVTGIDDITEEHIDTLRGIWTAINEGEPAESFFKPQETSRTEELKKKLGSKADKLKVESKPGEMFPGQDQTDLGPLKN
jgi:hypothetical protein